MRRRDLKNGLSIPPRLTLRNALDIARRPTWALSVLMGKRRTFGNLQGRLAQGSGLRTLSEWIGEIPTPGTGSTRSHPSNDNPCLELPFFRGE